MLEWYPEKRASAKEMLDHPWLNMKSNYNTNYSEAEKQKIALRSKLQQDSKKEMSELCDSDDEVFGADSEDNDASIDSDVGSDSAFYKVQSSGGRVMGLEEVESDDSDIENKLPGPNYLNNSFTGPYPEDMSRPNMDKGPNPQFLGFSKE